MRGNRYGQDTFIKYLEDTIGRYFKFLANVRRQLRYVHYMLSQFRLSVVCDVGRPTQPVKIFRNFVSPYDSPGTLVFWCQNSLVEEAPFPLKFAFKVTHPLSNSTISTNIYVYSSRRQNRPTARIKKTNRHTDKQTNTTTNTSTTQ